MYFPPSQWSFAFFLFDLTNAVKMERQMFVAYTGIEKN